jgi:hypothetical protein
MLDRSLQDGDLMTQSNVLELESSSAFQYRRDYGKERPEPTPDRLSEFANQVQLPSSQPFRSLREGQAGGTGHVGLLRPSSTGDKQCGQGVHNAHTLSICQVACRWTAQLRPMTCQCIYETRRSAETTCIDITPCDIPPASPAALRRTQLEHRGWYSK